MTIDKIIDKIQKLKAHAESAETIGNEIEAQAFAQLYQRLMLQHNIDMTDLEFEDLDVSDPVERHDVDFHKYGIKETTSQPWMVRLGNVVMRAHNCRSIRYTGSNRISIIGRKSDAQVAEWMFVTLTRAIQRIANDATAKYRWQSYKTHGSTAAAKGFKKAFVQGFIVRLSQRLEETIKEVVNTSTALVRVNEMKQKLDDFMKTQSVATNKSLMRPSNHVVGYARGTQAANEINLEGKAIADGMKRKEIS